MSTYTITAVPSGKDKDNNATRNLSTVYGFIKITCLCLWVLRTIASGEIYCQMESGFLNRVLTMENS